MMRIATLCFIIVFTFSLGQVIAPLIATAEQRMAMASQKSPAITPIIDWQKKWNDTVVTAKKEGEMVIYLNAPTETRLAITDAFNKKYGIKLNIVTGSGADLGSRLNTEYTNGIHQVDCLLIGAPTTLTVKANGYLSPISSMLVLPEVTDPKVWFDQRLPFFDRDGIVLAYISQVVPTVIYNTGLVKDGQITSYLDVLKPEWKGKIVMFDPLIIGNASFMAAGLTQELGADKANQFFTALVKQQEIVVTREMGQQMEWITRGKYPLALFPQPPAVIQYLKTGAPIASATFKELTGVSSANGGIAVPTNPPHPNATMVFVNWFLSREGQTVVVKSMGVPSMRADVHPEGVNPMFLLKPGQKYFLQSEEFYKNMINWMEGWKKIFTQARG